MQVGAITQYIDVAQLVLYAFWIFFAGLIYYLHQENKREGYPLESNVPGKNPIVGFPPLPSPKTYRLADGTTVTVPRAAEVARVIAGVPTGAFPGAPLEPSEPGMGAGIGPGAYAIRRDIPDVTVDGAPKIVPLRADPSFGVAASDVDPRGLPVVGTDGVVGGVVREIWVDRSDILFRYLEIEVPQGAVVGGAPIPAVTPVAVAVVTTPDSITVATATVETIGAAGSASAGVVLLPVTFARIGSRQVVVDSVMGRDLAAVPRTRQGDVVTFLEEERVMAFFGAGTLYATANRAEPLL